VILHDAHIAEKPGKNRPSESFYRQNRQFSAEKVPVGHFHPSKRVTLPMLKASCAGKIGWFSRLIRLRAGPWAPAMKAKPTALVVEDDVIQRSMVALLLEECEMKVIECDSGEDAARVLHQSGGELAMIYADVHLPGDMSGIDLAQLARQTHPGVHVVITSGDLSLKLPSGATFMPKPWRALDLLREAERSMAH
jgi:CheY-like chemotaxis protein